LCRQTFLAKQQPEFRQVFDVEIDIDIASGKTLRQVQVSVEQRTVFVSEAKPQLLYIDPIVFQAEETIGLQRGIRKIFHSCKLGQWAKICGLEINIHLWADRALQWTNRTVQLERTLAVVNGCHCRENTPGVAGHCPTE